MKKTFLKEFDSVPAIGEELHSDNITIMPVAERPEIDWIRSIDSTLYVGAYWEGEVFHITPLPEHINEIEAIVERAVKARTVGFPNIVVDNIQSRGNGPIYSLAERKAGKAFLLENLTTLNIQAVGLTKDGLVVFMNENATQLEKDNVLNISPVKSIEFSGAIFFSNPDEITEQENENLPLTQTKATNITLRGGNWLRTSSYDNTSIATSAVRNWNGSSGDIGLITCGHNWYNGQAVYASDGTYLGTADVREYNNMDVTFVKLNNTNLNSHGYMKDGKQATHNAAITEADIGNPVTRYGAKSGVNNGIIKRVDVSGTWGDYYFNNLFLTSCTTSPGDSGGAFTMITAQGKNAIIGLMKGAMQNSESVGSGSNIVYLESVVFPISAVISGAGFQPCT